MAGSQLEAGVRERSGVAIIDLDGEINGPAEEALNRAYGEAAALQPSGLLLNFQRVGYINSTGIALIVGVLMQARQAQVPVMTSGLSDHYVEIFQITRLADYMTIFPDEDAALAAQESAG